MLRSDSTQIAFPAMHVLALRQGAGVLEGFQLFLKYDYIKGIFAMSCMFMVEVTILDYMMKVCT